MAATEQTTQTITATASPAAAQNTETSGPDEQRIPKSRFDEVNNARKTAEEQLAEAKRQLQASQEATLAEQQKWQELAEQRQQKISELEPVKAQVDGYKQAVEATVARLVESLPEPMRDLVPDLDPVKKLDWLNKALPQLTKPKAPNLDAGVRGDDVHPVTMTDEERAVARKAGMSDEEYAKFR